MTLSKRTQRLLQNELAKAKEVNKRINGELLPEEKKLLKTKFPSGGLHVHDKDTPFVMHRHLLEEPIDGAHQHTTLNLGGEHVHGEFEGRALTDGEHYHKYNGTGYHYHEEEEDKGEIIPQSP